MKIMTTPTRSILLTLLTAMAAAVAFAQAEPAPARGANPVQTDQDQAKDKAKEKKKTVVKTDSGLQYVDSKEGEGEPPTKGQFCDVHYTGWLWENGAKGEKFDSSLDRGEPFSFHVGNKEVIKGWDEGVLTMKVGGKRELVIPADLAYGERGAGGGKIPPNATLLFEVELLAKWEKTESGLEYRELKEGTGVQPKSGQTCDVHYTGWLWNRAKGKKFDSSAGGAPISFHVGDGEVIKGWDEGVITMKAGGKRRLLIPAKLGYGARGYPPDIPPNAPLLFDVELVKVK